MNFDTRPWSTITIFDEDFHTYCIKEQNNEHTVIFIDQLTTDIFDHLMRVRGHCAWLVHVLIFVVQVRFFLNCQI